MSSWIVLAILSHFQTGLAPTSFRFCRNLSEHFTLLLWPLIFLRVISGQYRTWWGSRTSPTSGQFRTVGFGMIADHFNFTCSKLTIHVAISPLGPRSAPCQRSIKRLGESALAPWIRENFVIFWTFPLHNENDGRLVKGMEYEGSRQEMEPWSKIRRNTWRACTNKRYQSVEIQFELGRHIQAYSISIPLKTRQKLRVHSKIRCLKSLINYHISINTSPLFKV